MMPFKNEVIKTRMVPKPFFDEDILWAGDRVHAKRVVSITYDKDGCETSREYDIDENATILYIDDENIELQFSLGSITIMADEVQNGEWEIERL